MKSSAFEVIQRFFESLVAAEQHSQVVMDHRTRRQGERRTVFRFRTAGEPMLYHCGGLRTPSVKHCRYDPLPSDMLVNP